MSKVMLHERKCLSFFCPGCKNYHMVNYSLGGWGWNGDTEKPTLTPSVLVRSQMWTPPVTPENLEEWHRNPWKQIQVEHVCHSFVTDGNIHFLGDCNHALANQIVALPDIPTDVENIS